MQTYMFEIDGGNEILHTMDRAFGTIVANLGRAGTSGRPIHVPAQQHGRLEGQRLHRRDDQRAADPEVVHVECNNGNGKGNGKGNCS